VKLLREPVAAALAYGVDRSGDATVLVVDLGGGTYDVSLLDVGGGTVEVLATSGDAHLGGDDFDAAVARWLAEQPGADAPPRALQAAARALREALTARDAVAARMPGAPAPVRLTRAQMESLAAPLLSRLRRPLEQAAWAAGIDLEAARATAAEAEQRAAQSAAASPGTSKGGGKRGRRAAERAAADARAQARVSSRQRPSAAFALNRVISEVLLVGGATRMPAVQRVVAAMTARPVALGAVDPDEAVALGAALQAGALEGSVTDVETMEVWQAALMRALARKMAEDAGGARSPGEDDEDDEPEFERRRRAAPAAEGSRLTAAQEAQADALVRAMQGGEPEAASPRGRVRIVSASADSSGDGDWDEGELEGMDLDAIAALGLGDVVLDDGVTEVADEDALREQVGAAAFATLTAAEQPPQRKPRATKKKSFPKPVDEQ
jgi:molecular chaperone DnaK